MTLQEHPNTRPYLTRFLLHVRKHAIVEDRSEFEVEVQDDERLCPNVVEMLR